MKNLILSLIVLFSLSAVAQKQPSEAEARSALASSMVSFVESIKPAYKPGMTYEQFQNSLTGGARPTNEGSELIRKAHEFIAGNYSAAAIQSTYNGKEVAAVYLKLKSLKTSKGTGTGTDIFASTGNFKPFENKNSAVDGTKCVPWYDVFCQLATFVMWVSNNEGALCFIAIMFGLPCTGI